MLYLAGYVGNAPANRPAQNGTAKEATVGVGVDRCDYRWLYL